MLINKNDKIAIINPASPSLVGDYDLFMEKYSSYAYEISDYAFDVRDNIDNEQGQEIERVFSDTSIKAIICGRGGYGTTRRIAKINYDMIKNNPKPFFGFSDTTALQLALYKMSGIKSYTGLIAKNNYDNEMLFSSFDKIINKEKQNIVGISLSKDKEVEGQLIGGNLAIIASMVGTPYLPDFSGKILVLEEIDESPYRVDRMLYQLFHAGVLNNIKAICFGSFIGCVNPKYPDGKTVESYINDFVEQLKCPVIRGFPYGHQNERIIFQYDAFCEIKNNEMIIY